MLHVTQTVSLRRDKTDGLIRKLTRSVPGAPNQNVKSLGRDLLLNAGSKVVPVGDPSDAKEVILIRRWNGPLCSSRLVNHGTKAIKIREIILFDLSLPLPLTTKLYGEGFQMLSQTGGTLGQPIDLGNYADAKHYRLPGPATARVLYGMVLLSPPDGNNYLFAFTSCRRFSGQFYLRESSLQVAIDTEGLELGSGETWELEEFTFRSGSSRELLLAALAEELNRNHPRLKADAPPTGWCSWYCFGPRVTARQVIANLEVIAKKVPGLKYIQIDDGYQPAMGDWLETGSAFGGNVQGVLKEIREKGFQPAIWVAPFIAEEKSRLFTEHRDWFVKDESGQPLRSDRVTFGGWRHGPWYVLDGTQAAVQQHLENVFHTMRNEWGCTYFKLDANFWGAIHGGRFHDSRATRIEAYRRGLQAILRGAGDSFILGCNHPIWASLGLVHGSRSSNDIKRTWERIATTARQNLRRNWQNGRLWWNDPDAILLTGELSEEEARFHATAVYATGGMVLSGDDLTAIPADKLAMLRKLQTPTGVAARFAEDTFQVGRINLPSFGLQAGQRTSSSGAEVISLLNWDDAAQDVSFNLQHPSEVIDFWSGEKFGRHEGSFTIKGLPPHSGRLLLLR